MPVSWAIACKNNEIDSDINNYFDTSAAAWAKASQQLVGAADGVKLSRKQSGLSNSFIMLGGKIHELARKHHGNSHFAPNGGENSVKFALSRDLMVSVYRSPIKVGLNGYRHIIEDPDCKHPAKLSEINNAGYSRGSKPPKISSPHSAWSKRSPSLWKKVSIIDYKGVALIDLICKDLLNTQELLHILISLAIKLKHHHTKGILHCDIKPDNITVLHDDGNNIHVDYIDWDFSRKLPANSSAYVCTEARGTPDYVAPEILKSYRYSTASDIYALGYSMNEIAKLPQYNDIGSYLEAIASAMLESDYSKRCTLDDVIVQLINHAWALGFHEVALKGFACYTKKQQKPLSLMAPPTRYPNQLYFMLTQTKHLTKLTLLELMIQSNALALHDTKSRSAIDVTIKHVKELKKSLEKPSAITYRQHAHAKRSQSDRQSLYHILLVNLIELQSKQLPGSSSDQYRVNSSLIFNAAKTHLFYEIQSMRFELLKVLHRISFLGISTVTCHSMVKLLLHIIYPEIEKINIAISLLKSIEEELKPPRLYTADIAPIDAKPSQSADPNESLRFRP